MAQSLEYAEAKSNIESWTAKYGIIKNQKEEKAVIVVLEKSYGPLKLIRINRGPIFIDKLISHKDKVSIFKLIKREWSCFKGQLLFLDPILSNNSINKRILKSAGFINWSQKCYHSVWINLSSSEQVLRSNLKGSWRRNLVISERNNLELNISRSMDDFEFLLSKYDKMMYDKDFKGSSLELLKNYYNNSPNNLFIFKALNEKTVIASILIVKHGLNCTYWIGWNGEKGRKLRANHFLFWNIIMNMKKQQLLWFDLGGLNKKRTPGITRFKNGFGGEDYMLIGEWV